MPIGKQTKKKLDSWINENVNVPLSKRGMGDTGAALSAVLSAGGDLLIPDDLADAAVAMVPGARLLRTGKKGVKALKKVGNAAPALTIDYGAIKKVEKVAGDAKREMFDKVATAVKKDRVSGPTVKKPDLFSDELGFLEEQAKKQRLNRAKK